MSEGFISFAFISLSILLVGGAVGMLVSRSIVHAAFWLLAIATAAAGLFAILQASYVALMQLLIYAGAVAILNLFTIMITLRRREDAIRSRDFSLAGALLAGAFFALVSIAVVGESLPEAPVLDSFPGIAEFGEALFAPSGWALPFEIASLVLTAALIAAVWWSRGEGDR